MRLAVDSGLDEFVSLGGKVDELEIRDEKDGKYAVDFQYILMNRWAMEGIRKVALPVVRPTLHDFASKFEFAAYMSTFMSVVHYDIREPDAGIPQVEFSRADMTGLGLADSSLRLMSCLHVAEHIGLGRYGDRIDPGGFNKACAELSRVLADRGHLFFAVPVGRPRVVFNSHRVLSVKQVIDALPELVLEEFSGISSRGGYVKNAPLDSLDFDDYGCGLFHFVKEPRNV